jgi:cytochrome c oxidase cbb3-type subunit 3
MSDKHIDEISGVETTGHEWDGIRELNNPLPRWWVWTFYATIVWAVGYTIAYPAWPMIASATSGMLGYSSRQELGSEMKVAADAQAAQLQAIGERPLAEILADDNLRRFAVSAGAAAFKVNCSQCHGSGAQGTAGYPNLNDDDWLWGGDIEAIHQTIAHGVRFAGDDNTRVSEMPAFGEILEPEQVKQVAAYVVSLSGTPGEPALAEAGASVFADNCAACHAEDGTGNRELGAPNLVDAIWFYGAGEDAIAAQVRAPKHGVMPAWSARLGDATVKQLAVYVHSLGGGE